MFLLPLLTLAAPPPFELRDGDRIVLIGSTLVEREQRYGFWEAALTQRFADRKLTFRNLGWSGDTVWGDARAGFDTAKEGYQRLVTLTLAQKPTVLVIAYGTNEMFAGKAGLAAFTAGFNKLLDDLKPTGASLVFLAPNRLAEGRPNKATYERHVADRAAYTEAIQRIADERQGWFVDPYTGVEDVGRLMDDGIQLNAAGYSATTAGLLRGLGLGSPPAVNEALRQAVIDKNQLVFHRWRPQNETYLFGFRKHEQGQNAREIPQFDPLVADAEKQIAKLVRASAEGGK